MGEREVGADSGRDHFTSTIFRVVLKSLAAIAQRYNPDGRSAGSHFSLDISTRNVLFFSPHTAGPVETIREPYRVPVNEE